MGVLVIRESYYLGDYMRGPSFLKPPSASSQQSRTFFLRELETGLKVYLFGLGQPLDADVDKHRRRCKLSQKP